jgi:3-hydroxymyristoyl/3-hydroxydecanoyl-(acyl carrier protein) dehydratase
MSETTVFVLPHGYPFRLLDRVLGVEAGGGAVAVRGVTHDDPLVDEGGTLPAALLAEALAQCAGLAISVTMPDARGVLARIDRFRSRGPLRAAVELRMKVRIVRVFGAVVKVRGVVLANGQRWAAGEVTLRLERSPAGVA